MTHKWNLKENVHEKKIEIGYNQFFYVKHAAHIHFDCLCVCVCIVGENNLSVWNYTHVIKTFKIPLKETRTLFFYMITRCVNEKQILISKINGYQCRYRINFFSHCDFGRQKKTKSRQFAQLFSLVEYIIINFWKKNISIRLTNFSKDTSLLGDVFL